MTFGLACKIAGSTILGIGSFVAAWKGTQFLVESGTNNIKDSKFIDDVEKREPEIDRMREELKQYPEFDLPDPEVLKAQNNLLKTTECVVSAIKNSGGDYDETLRRVKGEYTTNCKKLKALGALDNM